MKLFLISVFVCLGIASAQARPLVTPRKPDLIAAARQPISGLPAQWNVRELDWEEAVKRLERVIANHRNNLAKLRTWQGVYEEIDLTVPIDVKKIALSLTGKSRPAEKYARYRLEFAIDFEQDQCLTSYRPQGGFFTGGVCARHWLTDTYKVHVLQEFTPQFEKRYGPFEIQSSFHPWASRDLLSRPETYGVDPRDFFLFRHSRDIMAEFEVLLKGLKRNQEKFPLKAQVEQYGEVELFSLQWDASQMISPPQVAVFSSEVDDLLVTRIDDRSLRNSHDWMRAFVTYVRDDNALVPSEFIRYMQTFSAERPRFWHYRLIESKVNQPLPPMDLKRFLPKSREE